MNHHAVIYQHSKRPEWGYGAVVDAQDDRTMFTFDDGSNRTIKRDHIHMMVEVELQEPEAAEVQKRIAKFAAKTLGADRKPKAKKKPAAKKVAKAAVVEAPAT